MPVIKEQGADIIIALSHSGIDGKGPSERMENASLYLAGVEGVDAVFTGHQHLVFPGPKSWDGIPGADAVRGALQGKPAVMAGFWGSHLGLIDLLLEKDGRGWRIVDFTSEARPIYHRDADRKVIADVSDDADVIAAALPEHEATLAYVRRPVGKTSAPLYSYFALVADDPSIQIVANAQIWYVQQMLKDGPYADLPVLSAAAPFKAGGRGGADYYTEVPAGDIAIKNVADLYLYPNTVQAVLITGAEVKDWLEMSAGIFNQVKPGSADTALINTGFPSYNYDVIDGVTYQIDLSQPARFDGDGQIAHPQSNRIINLRFGGQPIDPAQKFVVATNNYRASGGGKFPGLTPDKIILVAPDTNRDVIVRYILDQGMINPSADGNWSFAPQPGSSALFETGPRAHEFASALKGVRVEAAGEAPEGFARFRLLL